MDNSLLINSQLVSSKLFHIVTPTVKQFYSFGSCLDNPGWVFVYPGFSQSLLLLLSLLLIRKEIL